MGKHRRVTIIINTPNGILVVSKDGNQYMLPGNVPNIGESDYDCIIRTLKEEMGLTPNTCSFLFDHTSKNYYHKVHLVTILGDPLPCNEIKYIKYFKNTNLPLLISSIKIIKRYENKKYHINKIYNHTQRNRKQYRLSRKAKQNIKYIIIVSLIFGGLYCLVTPEYNKYFYSFMEGQRSNLDTIGRIIDGGYGLNDFQSLNECITFLTLDNTNTYTWTSDFTCESFTRMLIVNAKNKGYYLKYLALDGYSLEVYQSDYVARYGGTWGAGSGHAICAFSIGDKNYVIEPQTDVVLEIKNGHYFGVWKGEY